MSEQIETVLNQCRMFKGINEQSLKKMSGIGQMVSYRKGETIFQQDQFCPGLFIVASGMVRVYKLAPSGKEHILHMPGPGDTFAEVATIGQFVCPAGAAALEPTTCVLLPVDLFNGALDEDHRLCRELLLGLSMRVRQFVGLLEDIVLRDATGRLAAYLIDKADDQGRVDMPSLKRYVANHLNLTSETLSRTLRRLTEANLIKPINHLCVQLQDREALLEIAEGISIAL